jgi:Ferritin-like domain
MTAVPSTPTTDALPRRKFLALGGFSVATAAVLAACGGPGGEGAGTGARVAQAGETPVTTALPERVVNDAVLLRTASSLEHSAVAIYNKAFGMNLLTGEAAEFAKRFQDHHAAYAKFFEGLTSESGGTPFTTENPAVTKNIVTPAYAAIEASADKAGDLRNMLHSLENVITETYQSFVPLLTVPKLRAAAMSVGAAEARHAAVWAGILGGPVAASLAPKVETTTTTVKGAVEVVVVPVYQAPQAFSAMGLVPTLLNAKKVDLDLLGPNSFAY